MNIRSVHRKNVDENHVQLILRLYSELGKTKRIHRIIMKQAILSWSLILIDALMQASNIMKKIPNFSEGNLYITLYHDKDQSLAILPLN